MSAPVPTPVATSGGHVGRLQLGNLARLGPDPIDVRLTRMGSPLGTPGSSLALPPDVLPTAIGTLGVDHVGVGGGGDGFWAGRESGGGRRGFAGGRRLRLYSAMVVTARGGELVHLFHASVAPSASVVRERMRSRFGAAAAAQADIRVGVDLGCETTVGMLPPVFRDMVEVGRRVRWSAMAGLDVTVEHRIPS